MTNENEMTTSLKVTSFDQKDQKSDLFKHVTAQRYRSQSVERYYFRLHMLKGLTGTEKECYHYYLGESRISLKVSFSAHFLSVKKSLEPMVN